ncbi:MAG: hypothetical protein MOB07_03875 [Acidobacteria bacterium]|nr:hypothetical protein [Acidobacteriota bacterium]
MFITLLVVTFAIAFAVASVVVIIFNKPIQNILGRIISDEISQAWAKYLRFAIYVVGVSGGVRIWELEKYISKGYMNQEILALNWERWVLEVYRTVIGTLQSAAWLLLVFFIFALVAYVIVRVFELRQAKSAS